MLTEYIESQIGDRPDLMAKCVPDFPPYGKRLIVDNGWYQALRRDNVRLETTPIVGITATGVTTRAGHDELDVLVFATGFQADKILWPIHVTGRGGIDVTAATAAEPEAYLGIAAADARTCSSLLALTGCWDTAATACCSRSAMCVISSKACAYSSSGVHGR